MRERNAPPGPGEPSAKASLSALRLLSLGMPLVPRDHSAQEAVRAQATVQTERLLRYGSRRCKACEPSTLRHARGQGALTPASLRFCEIGEAEILLDSQFNILSDWKRPWPQNPTIRTSIRR